jgi:hypothetical protein
MTTLSQFTGGRQVASIVNYFSAGGVNQANVGSVGATKEIASGATGAAGTLTTVLSISGGGAINYLSAFNATAVSRTIRLKLTIDGVSVFDATSSASASSNTGLVAVGSAIGSSIPGAWQPVCFSSSLLVQVASSVSSETDTITVGVNYETDV